MYRKVIFDLKFIKSVYAGNVLGLGVLGFIFCDGGISGAIAFSFCFFISAVLNLPFFVSRISRVLVKEETVLGLITIAAGNVMGLLVDLLLLMPAPWFSVL